jgi:hypothetical protein
VGCCEDGEQQISGGSISAHRLQRPRDSFTQRLECHSLFALFRLSFAPLRETISLNSGSPLKKVKATSVAPTLIALTVVRVLHESFSTGAVGKFGAV